MFAPEANERRGGGPRRSRIPTGSKNLREKELGRCKKDKGPGLSLSVYCSLYGQKDQAEVDSHGKIRPQAGPLNRRKPDISRRAPNTALRPREYLTEREIERLQETARKRSRYGHRDATMILVAYRHGLRASEVRGLRWDQIDLNSGRLHVRRAKGGIDNVHPLSGKEIRALRQLHRENMETRYVFITERGGPATTAGFLKMIARTGEAAKLPFPVHPHMLRHSTGYKLANDCHDTRALQHYNSESYDGVNAKPSSIQPVTPPIIIFTGKPSRARRIEVVLLSGVTVTVKVAHVRLYHSRMLFVRAYPRETQEMVFDAHDRAFAASTSDAVSKCLDDKSWLKPSTHIWTNSAQPWVRIARCDNIFTRQNLKQGLHKAHRIALCLYGWALSVKVAQFKLVPPSRQKTRSRQRGSHDRKAGDG